MTAEEILNAVSSDPKIAELVKLIEQTSASFDDANRYSIQASRLIGDLLSKLIPQVAMKDREELCILILRGEHQNINRLLSIIQKRIDAKNGIHIRPKIAEFPFDRAQKIARSLADATVPEETIQRRANTGIENVCRSLQDDFYKTNAAFRYDAGIESYIVRVSSGKCCAWCDAIAGRYVYSKSMPKDVFRRHDNCGCTVTYESGRQRQNVWTKKSWTVPAVGAGTDEPTRMTEQQMQNAIEKNKLRKLAA